MANKIRFHQTIDSKSIFMTVIVIILLASLFYMNESFSPALDSYKLSKYDMNTVGKLISADEQIIFRQTRMGSEPIIDNVRITFTYQVGKEILTSSKIVNGTTHNISNLRKIMSSSGRIIKIKYQSDYPSKSMVDLLSD